MRLRLSSPALPHEPEYIEITSQRTGGGSGFSNLVVEFEEDKVKTAFILNYVSTQEYLQFFLVVIM